MPARGCSAFGIVVAPSPPHAAMRTIKMLDSPMRFIADASRGVVEGTAADC
jgi:hypothetical protein